MTHRVFIACCGVLLAPAQQPDVRPDIHIDVQSVTVPCAVANREGIPAGNLKADDFRLFDDGQSHPITSFWQESDLPLTVALVADISGSQANYIRGHREDLSQFLTQVIGPRDRAMIVEISNRSRLISGLSASSRELSAAVATIGTPAGARSPDLGPACRNPSFPHSCGGTALWHGLYYTAKELKSVSGRKAIVVLSDGLDTGSDIPLTTLVELAQSAGVVVYCVKYSSRMRFLSPGGAIAQAVSHGLERLSRETGGLIFPNPGRNAPEVFSKIESDLRNLYMLGFTPPDAPDGRFHTLEVTTTRPGLVVRTRPGYWSGSSAR